MRPPAIVAVVLPAVDGGGKALLAPLARCLVAGRSRSDGEERL